MTDNAPPQTLYERLMTVPADTGAVNFVASEGKKHKSPVVPNSIKSIKPDEENQSTGFNTTHNTKDSQLIEERGDMQTKAQLARTEVIEEHLKWLRNHKVRPWNERATWCLSGSKSDPQVEDINWGHDSPTSDRSMNDGSPKSIVWDGLNAESFRDALRYQNQNGSSRLSHIELDVQGLDADGNRMRVQRTLEVKLKSTHQIPEQGNVLKTTMKLKRVLIISPLNSPSSPPTRPNAREVYQGLLEQIAQHEVDKAFDERNHYLRAVFGQDVDHVRTRWESTVPAHEWSFHLPEVCIRGRDGTIIGLREKRTDSASGGQVVLTYTIVIEQVHGGDRKDHLFDLPSQGCESERQIRQARWSISSAIDRCIASGSAERFVLGRWVHGAFLPRE
ncbi:hypothetical protein BGZ57DRAFT_930522 [Hyaloscypha finlandica]|nr:hypothetical protein BGZ57DRAFT_930522 [Hyaloscypha finlandica]